MTDPARVASSHATAYGVAWPTLLLATPMVLLLAVPLVALGLGTSVADLRVGVADPLFVPALWLSARTTAVSLGLIVLLGTPLAWGLAVAPPRVGRWVEALVDLPVVIPPAVVGIALLRTFGRGGVFGGWIETLDLQIPFTTAAVIVAQVVVASPFYIQSAAAAFRRVDADLLVVARSLGHSRHEAVLRVALPLAAPGLIAGAALAWARALGEFGATLLFAGNASGVTQTMPLAIYMALESDVRTAVAISLVLAGCSLLLLLALRWAPSAWSALHAATFGRLAVRREGDAR